MANTVNYLLLLCAVQCYAQNSYYFENHKYCDDLSPYEASYKIPGTNQGVYNQYQEINLDQILGVWYGVEKIPHSKGEYRIEHTTHECFYIDIKEQYIQPTAPTPYPPLTNTPYSANRQYLQEPYRIRYFVLEWHEGIYHDDYHVKVNTSHKGFWPTDVPNGSVENMYRFFGGVIQVLKVANNYLVLNFCMRLPNSQLFSVVLSRNENQLTPEDLASIHNVFSKKHLSASSLKRVCENSATDLQVSMLLFCVAGFLIWRYRS